MFDDTYTLLFPLPPVRLSDEDDMQGYEDGTVTTWYEWDIDED